MKAPPVLYDKVLVLGLGYGLILEKLKKIGGAADFTVIENDPAIIDENAPEWATVLLDDGVAFYNAHKDDFNFIYNDMGDTRLNQGWLKTDGWSIGQYV